MHHSCCAKHHRQRTERPLIEGDFSWRSQSVSQLLLFHRDQAAIVSVAGYPVPGSSILVVRDDWGTFALLLH
jgi:hypothetical protein